MNDYRERTSLGGSGLSIYSVIRDGSRFLTSHNEGTSITESRLTAANRYAEMVRWMAWPRNKISRSSAQPGTHPHNGVQATVTPAPDAEPAPGSGHNTGVGGTTHAVAFSPSGSPGSPSGSLGRNEPAPDRSRIGRRLRPIRYAHGPAEEPAPAPATPPSAVPPTGTTSSESTSGTV